jgi:putative holliday junction resolvase
MQTEISNIIALDVGDKRVGVARANSIARLPSPLVTLTRGDNFWLALEKLVADESAGVIVVGLPRNLEGNDTAQTKMAREFIVELKKRFDIPVETTDEALTSHKAEKELNARGKTYNKGDIDALAATYILEDYLNETS